jgi:hypothetical protein
VCHTLGNNRSFLFAIYIFGLHYLTSHDRRKFLIESTLHWRRHRSGVYHCTHQWSPFGLHETPGVLEHFEHYFWVAYPIISEIRAQSRTRTTLYG